MSSISSPAHQHSQVGRGLVFSLGLTLAAAFTGAFGQPSDQAAQASPLPKITTIEQYWNLSVEEKSRPVIFLLECDVTYADPTWKMLYIQDNEGLGAYVPYGDNTFPFKAGQHLVAEGTFVPPNADISFEHATITLQGSSRLVP